jgi:pimeloyl-ACP methyl ester carboxylesterase
MKAAFATIDGLTTRYFVAGAGPALILVHPVGYPAEVFTRTLTGLRDRFLLVAPDLPGQGFSDRPPVWHAAPQVVMADHVLALADHLGLRRFSILGSSLGGLVAALVAQRAPDRVDNLIVVGSGSVFNDPAGQPNILKTVYANGSRAYADPSLEACRARIANTCYRPPSADDILLTQLTAYARPGAAESYKSIIDGLIASVTDPAATVYPHLEKIRTRTLALVGANDTRTSAPAHRDGAARMPNATFASLPECGHLPFVERPAEFNALLSEFLQGAAHSPESRGAHVA